MSRHDEIKKYIEKRVLESIEKSQEDLIQVSISIRQLNAYINEEVELSTSKVYNVLNWLVSHFTLSLIYELEKNVVLRRSRKYEEKDSTSYCFTVLQDLLSIPDSKKDIVQMGRMNKDKNPMYYGVISDRKFNKFDTALSEVNAVDYDYVNILDSRTIKPMTSLYIGAFDLFVRGKEMPTWVHSQSKEIFQILQDGCEKNKNEFLFESYTLCNSFLADILSRKHKGKLYDVTSILASLLLESKELDSIIYESVQVKGAPVIVIKPSAVEEAIIHETVISYKVLSSLGYGIYRGKAISKGTVECCKLKWEQ